MQGFRTARVAQTQEEEKYACPPPLEGLVIALWEKFQDNKMDKPL